MNDINLTLPEKEIVVSILRRYVPDRYVVVFGSRVKRTAKPFSDLDIAILGEQPLSIATLAQLNEDFTESALQFKVDIVDWATTKESFRKIINSEGIDLPFT